MDSFFHTPAMDIGTDPFISIHGSHGVLTTGAFGPLFLLCIADDLVKHRILEDAVHKLALIGYLTVNPRLHVDINRPCSD